MNDRQVQNPTYHFQNPTKNHGKNLHVPLYTRPSEYPAMKKQHEQKTKGHKATENPAPASLAQKKTAEPLDAQKIASLKDKNAAKMKKKRH